ncbi:MAG: GrpB family protein [Candidatus Cloacimonetes bacterium]|nr:GrpB family protein [Candidatus Cloacimonadota bacterium]
MIGLSSDMVVISKYSRKWKMFYEDEEILIKNNLKKLYFEIEHIGSTAIKDLDAKPIIDIMIGYFHKADLEKIINSLESIKYINKGEAGIPERIFLKKDVKDKTTHHIHLTEIESEFWSDHILFRDFLDSHENLKIEYQNLKYEFSDRYKNDREKYTESKSDFIQKIIAKAKNS